jgi:hypothetical protein
MDDRRTSLDPTTRVRAAIDATLERGEIVSHAVRAIGCTIALTNRHLILARDGSAFRPKTGIRRWQLDDRLAVRAGLLRHGTGTLVIQWDRDATSVFVDAESWDEALALVGATYTAIRRSGRSSRS